MKSHTDETNTKTNAPLVFKGITSDFWLRVARWSIVLLVGLLPVFVWPGTTDAVGYGKQLLLVTLGGVAFISWLLQALLAGTLKIRRGVFLWFIILMLIGVLAAITFSSDMRLAFWGATPNGLSGLNFLAFGIFAFVTYVIADQALLKRAVTALMLGLTGAVVVSVLSLYSINIFSLVGLSGNGFTPLGSVNSLSIVAGATLVFSIQALLNRDQWLAHNKLLAPIAGIAVLASIIAVISINFRPTWLGIAIAGMFITITSLAGRRVINPKFFILPFILVFVSIALYLQLLPVNFGLKSTPLEINLAPPTSFSLVTESFKAGDFFFGSGFGTFADIYIKNRPLALNNTAFWGIRFNQASSGLYTLLAEGGYLMTAIIAAFMIVTAALSVVRNRGVSPYLVAFSVFVTLFVLYPFSLTLWALLFITGAFASIGLNGNDQKNITTLNLARSTIAYLQASLGLTALLLFVGFGVIFQWQRVFANHALAGPVNAATIDQAIASLSQSIATSYGNDDDYLRAISQAYLLAANQTTTNSQDQVSLIRNALGAAQAAVAYGPKNVLNSINFASVYEAIIGVADGAAQFAENTYNQAIELDPFNPSLPAAIGRAQFREAQRLQSRITLIRQSAQSDREQIAQLEARAEQLIASSEDKFNESLRLKPDYEPAHLLLAQLFDSTGRRDEAIKKATDIVAINPRDAGNWFRLGLLYYQERDYERSRDALGNAVQLSEAYSNARYFLGLSLEQLNDTKGAIEQFKRIQELNPDNPEVAQILANLERGVNPLLNVSPPEPQDRIQPPVPTPNDTGAEQTTDIENQDGQERQPLDRFDPEE